MEEQKAHQTNHRVEFTAFIAKTIRILSNGPSRDNERVEGNPPLALKRLDLSRWYAFPITMAMVTSLTTNEQAPKVTANAAKAALCHQWITKSGTAHTIKDLEKALPSVASINGMVVKDYVQHLTDENMIRVEKIGSGNWYWSFPSEARLRSQENLIKAEKEREKSEVTVDGLKRKIENARIERSEIVDGCEVDRASMLSRNEFLRSELLVSKTELDTYSDNDPVEFARRQEDVEKRKLEASELTDQILSMERWMKNLVDRDQFLAMIREWYGVEFDEGEEGLREL